MRYYVILLVVMQLSSFSQEYRIQYDFPPKVDTIIAIAMDSSVVSNNFNSDSMGYYLTLSVSDTTFLLELDTYYSKRSVFDSVGKIVNWISFLVINSNRFTKVTGRDIPIVLESDFKFGTPKLLDEGKGGRIVVRPRFEFRKRFKVLVDSRSAYDYKIYKMGFW
ncbi:hypothetical protein [Vallitalea sp.]|jgi:hypothetical protein|uniref:hypothetical protein n=1 Tax=Vallitalea sp. TaxID=1882829 RepID=UPI0025F0F14F|nr:hypothetical protein [Vallitalea sp.]MCT4685692.1 hypothetical protein [Vallitalea sp.]